MASRQEEKEQRRREREEAERAAKAAEARRKRLGIVLGGVLAAAVIAIVVVAVLNSGGDGGDGPAEAGTSNAALPATQTEDIEEAVEAAGCTFEEFDDEGNNHLAGPEDTFDDYKTNPPTSGTHRPVAAADGVYVPGRSPDPESWVHTLEHGRVILQYAPRTPQRRIDQLETLMNEPVGTQPSGYKTVLLENNTDMPFQVAAVSWTRYLGCEEFTDRSFDALRAFRNEYVESPEAPEADLPWPQR